MPRKSTTKQLPTTKRAPVKEVRLAQPSGAPISSKDIDAEAFYRVKLHFAARHGTSLMRPRDAHVVIGAHIDLIEPREAIESIERIS